MSMSSMVPPPAFKLPTHTQPLDTLSPERVNGLRLPSALSTTATQITRTSEPDTETDYPYISSAHSSPTRKANLFADYHPSNGTPTKTSGFALPQSPSLPDIHTLRSHARTNSDVQGLVKRFEHLDVRDRNAESAERRKKHDAELRRAQIAREEAESDVKRLREEMRRMKKDFEEGRERERRVAKRLENIMEEYASTKESHSSQSVIYEKEVRRARKEAFKSSSAVVKLQEELKSTRNSLRITQSGFEMEKQKVQRREQETFNAQYQLVAVQEELEKLQAHVRIVGEEKEALKTSLKEEEVARMAAEGMIALPAAQDDDDDEELIGSLSKRRSPQKRIISPWSDDKENVGVVSKKTMQTKQLEEQLLREQMRREHAEEMVDFLTMECAFQCCKCRTAAKGGQHLSVSDELAAALDVLKDEVKSVLSPMEEPHQVERIMDVGADAEPEVAAVELNADIETDVVMVEAVMQPHVEEDFGMTMPIEEPGTKPTGEGKEPEAQEEAQEEAPKAPHPTPTETDHVKHALEAMHPDPSLLTDPQTPSHLHETRPFRPRAAVRTVTTTTTIPMHFTPISKPHIPYHPENSENIPPQINGPAGTPTFDRAAALAAIEYRRGRAKSIAEGHVTPRKQMLEGVNVKERRDISAPALGGKTGGMGFGKNLKAGSVGRGTGRTMGF